jgi:hypothetical protein
MRGEVGAEDRESHPLSAVWAFASKLAEEGEGKGAGPIMISARAKRNIRIILITSLLVIAWGLAPAQSVSKMPAPVAEAPELTVDESVELYRVQMEINKKLKPYQDKLIGIQNQARAAIKPEQDQQLAIIRKFESSHTGWTLTVDGRVEKKEVAKK